jgi:hypothetical protein
MAKVILASSTRGVAMMFVLGIGFWRESWVLPDSWWVWENSKLQKK